MTDSNKIIFGVLYAAISTFYSICPSVQVFQAIAVHLYWTQNAWWSGNSSGYVTLKCDILHWPLVSWSTTSSILVSWNLPLS